jgi:alkanesulfonate monooxygenase SsuD/methylene tetrahydromethanopterin reductase-like flavin-dependent oxidoreductase (luciferase family)
VELGINLLNYGPATDAGVLRGWSDLADEAGYGWLTISDHVAITADVAKRYPETFWDPFTTAAWLAGVNPRVRLGTSVVVIPYRHPLLVARLSANVHDLSGGRFSLGIGVGGGAPLEFAALGVELRGRGRRTDEAMLTIRQAWQTYGRGAESIPLWVGGQSDGALARTDRLGAQWHPLGVTIERMREVMTQYGWETFVPRLKFSLTDEPIPEDRRKDGEGSAEQILADVAELEAIGATAVILDPYAGNPAELDDPTATWDALRTIGAAFHRAQTNS